MYCAKCGNEVSTDDKFCSKCGTSINDTAPEKKSFTSKYSSFIALLVVIGVFVCIQLAVNYSNKLSAERGEIAGAQAIRNRDIAPILPTSTTVNSNLDKYKNTIIDKWNATLPLNSTKGLEGACYDISKDNLYLKYNFGICVVYKDNRIERYVQPSSEYSLYNSYIDKAKNDDTGYVYLTASNFEKIIGNTEVSKQSVPSNNLSGNHKLIYFDGIDLSGINGYLILNDDETFKIYANYTVANMELINIEGTYTISNDKIKIKITKEGGYDLGSQSRDDIITIADDNLAYSGYKFAR